MCSNCSKLLQFVTSIVKLLFLMRRKDTLLCRLKVTNSLVLLDKEWEWGGTTPPLSLLIVIFQWGLAPNNCGKYRGSKYTVFMV